MGHFVKAVTFCSFYDDLVNTFTFCFFLTVGLGAWTRSMDQ